MTVFIGFTGTRTDLPPAQRAALEAALRSLHVCGASLAHGDCVGADFAAHEIAMRLGYMVHVLPPLSNRYRAFCLGHQGYAPAEYMIRNRRIASMCTRLVAAPLSPEAEAPRSGTWATVRMARNLGKGVTLVWPDGRVEDEPGAAAQVGGEVGAGDPVAADGPGSG